MIKFILFLLLAFPFCVIGKNIDSFLLANNTSQNPYLIVNITSADCINCRAGSVKVLQQLKKADLSSKIVLLSDTRKMALYFDDNKDIYEGYKTIYNKELSDELALGPSCTVCLIDKNKVRTWLFKNIDNDTLNMFINILNSSSSSTYRRHKIRDSLFDNLIDVHLGENHIVLFDDKFQISLYYDFLTQKTTYHRAEVTDSAANYVYSILSSNGMSASAPASFVRKHLRFDALPLVMANSIDRNSGSLLFRLFQAKLDSITLPNGKRDLNVNFYTQAIVGSNAQSNNNILNIGDYKDYLLLDTIRHDGKLYMASQTINHQVKNGRYYIPYISNANAKVARIEGRDVHTATELAVFEFEGKSNSKPILKNVYTVPDYMGEARPDIFFRINNKGTLVVVNNVKKKITILNNYKNIDFPSLAISGEPVAGIFDLSITDENILFVATTNQKIIVKGSYNMQTGKTNLTKLHTDVSYERMCIRNNEIIGCYKNKATNELYIDMFTF